MEFGYLRLSDGFSRQQHQAASAPRCARRAGSKAVGQAQAIVTAVHNTPFGDIVDTEDDLQPLIASMFRDATRMVTLVGAAMRLADFDVAKLASRAALGGTTLTELADTLVRDHGLSFRSAHAIAASLLKARTEDPQAPLSTTLSKRRRAILGKPLEYAEADLERIMSPRHLSRFGRPRRSCAAVTGRAIGRDRSGSCRPIAKPGGSAASGWRGRVKPRHAREGALMRSTYVRVAIVWVMTLAALYAFQSASTR